MPRVKLQTFVENLPDPVKEESIPEIELPKEEPVCNETPVKELRRVRVPGTIFEVDELGNVHVPKSLLDNLFPVK